MKLAIILTDISNDGGVQKAVANFVCNFKDDYDIHIISVFNSNKSSKYLNVISGKCNINFMFDKPFSIRKHPIKLMKKLRGILNENNFDYIICAGIFYSPYLYFANLFNKKSINIAWNHTSYKNAKIFGLDWIGRNFAILLFDKIISITQVDYNNFINNRLLLNKGKIEHIYNFSNYSTENAIDSNVSRKKHLLTIGTLSHIKGLDFIIDIAIEIKKKYPDWKWYVLGDGKLSGDLKNKYDEHELSDFLIFTGYIENPEKYYQKSSIFVLTSRAEGFGYVVLEAKRYKLPVISFSCNNIIDEILVNNKDGLIIEDGNLSDFTYKLKLLMENDLERRLFSQHSKKHKFIDRNIKKKWRKILR